MNKVAGLFIIFFAVSIFKSCENVQKFDPQFFQNISNDIHDTLSRVFGELQLPDQLQEADRFRLLWIMHNNMNSIAQNYFKIYIEIVNASKVVNKTVNSLSTLNNVIEEMAQEENVKTVRNSTDVFNLTRHVASHEASMMFISDFTKKFENFSIADILNKAVDLTSYKTKPKRIKSSKRNRYKRKRRNLKLWLPPNSSEEVNQNLTRRVLHMENEIISQFPFIASIHALGEFVCAGAILSNYAVITAASCLHFVYQDQKVLQDNKSLKVRVGTEFPNKLGLMVPTEKVTFHPLYNPMTLENNLAILKLKWTINIKHKSKHVMRVSYGKIEGALQRNVNKIIMLGWGDKDSIPHNEHLSVTNMDIVQLKKCKSIYTEKYVTTKNFCGAILKKSTQSPTTCQRDIGSPAVIGNLLVGLVSYGPSVCAPPSAPTVYTDLGTYVDWINKTLPAKPVSVSSTFDDKKARNTMVLTTSTSSPKPLTIQFRQSQNADKQIYSELRAQILAKAQNIVTPLQNSYPEAIKFLSFLLKQIVDGNMRAEENEKPNTITTDANFQPRTAVVETIRSSEEYANKRPERYGDDDVDDVEPDTTTAVEIRKGKVVSNEIDSSEQMETEDFSFANDGLSISIETTKITTSYIRPKTTTVAETRPPKPVKHKSSKSKNNNRHDKSLASSRSKKKIKNFNDLQKELEKEVSAKQDERLKYQKDLKETQQKKQKQVKEESEEDEATKSEIENIIKEIKNRKRKKSASATSVSKDDKNASIRKIIEEILSKEDRAREEIKISKKKAKAPQIQFDVKKKKEPSEEDEETEAEDDKTTTVTTKNIPKTKIQKPLDVKKSKFEKNKESYEIQIQSDVKKKVKHTGHKQTPHEKRTTEIRLTKLAAEEVLDKNFKLDEKVYKKEKKSKNTTPFILASAKSKSSKTTRQRAFEFKVNIKPTAKIVETEYENTSTDTIDSIDSCNSDSSKDTPFTLPQRLKKAKPVAFLPPFDSYDESPMLLPPAAMADFQLATRDRLLTTADPQLSAMDADLVLGDDEANHNSYEKLATRGIMTIDDLNIQMGIPEEWAFRRHISSNVSSLEAFIKAVE